MGSETLPVTYFPTSPVYPFTLRVTGSTVLGCVYRPNRYVNYEPLIDFISKIFPK